MVRLVYSNRTEELLAELGARVRELQLKSGPLVVTRVVVPSSSVEGYVWFGVARQCGIAANLQAMHMTRFAAETIAEATGARVAVADDFEALALTLLLDEAVVGDAELGPVRAYLASGKAGDAVDVRRVQLAARIGRLFEEYTYSRPEMLRRWSTATTLSGAHLEAERWQRRLWLSMFGADGLGRERGFVPIHEAVAALPSSLLGGSANQGPTVHLFGFAHFARTFHELVRSLAKTREIVVYSLSPCEGFWEDFDRDDPPPLTLWGRPGREHVRALNATAGFDHDDRFVEPSGDSLLAELQRDLLKRRGAREVVDAPAAFAGDESILFLEHASVRRELEVVASEIWRLVEGDPGLRFDEIAVLVPDADAPTYLAHVRSVFRETHGLPWQAVELSAPGEGGVLEAVEMLLSLPLGRFSRQDLLRLAVHPAVAASVDGADPELWLEWCDALGIVHGADRSDHEDTYIERDILNWDQGLRRLALGVFMAGDRSGERRPFEVGGEAYVPLEVGASDVSAAAALGLLVRSLVADARYVRSAVLPLRDWATRLCALVETYVAAIDDAEAERMVGLVRRLLGVGAIDLGGRPVPYRVAYELARRRLASFEPTRRGEGVVVSRVSAAKSLPHRVVFACGMGEGRYPSSVAEDPLDLRWAHRLEGDVTSRERDKYAFLELLLGTRDRLYLSHVSRDPLTGDPVAPSSVAQELARTLGHGYVADVAALRRRHPLRRWDPGYFPDVFGPVGHTRTRLGTIRLPEAHAEAQTLAARLDMEAHGLRAGTDDVEAAARADARWALLADHLRIERLPEVASSIEGRVTVPMHALVKFLEFPLQGWARYRIGLDELEEEDVLAREDEPFETHVRDETLLLRSVLMSPQAPASLEQAYDEVVRGRELRGTGPSGLFAQAERTEHLHTLEQWTECLTALDVSLDGIQVHRFGRGGEHATATHVHPALTIDVDVCDAAGVTRIVRAELGGRTLPLGGAAGASSITLTRRIKDSRDDWARADRERATLRAFVDHAVLAASGVGEPHERSSVLVVATPQEAVTERVVFEALSQGEATAWLRGLLRELLGGPHAYFFPVEAVFLWREKDPGGPLSPWMEAARDQLRDGERPALRSAYGPVSRPTQYPMVAEAQAREMVERRFGMLLRKRRGEA